jgi:hypothetical protein
MVGVCLSVIENILALKLTLFIVGVGLSVIENILALTLKLTLFFVGLFCFIYTPFTFYSFFPFRYASGV